MAEDGDNLKNYTVQQGDFVSKLAARFGFSDFRAIWDHPQNQKLKQERKSPNLLAPGDTLAIPEKESRTASCTTDAEHKFTLLKKPLKLRLVIKDMTGAAVAGKSCDVRVTGSTDVAGLSTDGSGLVQRDIAADANEGKLMLKDAGVPIDIQLDLRVGHLDPIDKITGWKGRLNSLGYDAGELNADETLQLKSAVEEFQCDHKLHVDGVCGPQTQAKLKEVHGC